MKIKLLIGLILFLSIFTLTSIYWKWPCSYTEPATIAFTDQSTRSPIPGALVEVKWSGYYHYIEPGGKTYKKIIIMTDKNGEVHIPRKLNIHFFSIFETVSADFLHPDYEQNRLFYYWEGTIKNRSASNQENVDRKRMNNPIVKVLSMIDKYRDVECYSDPKKKRGNYCEGIKDILSDEIQPLIRYFQYVKVKGKTINYNSDLIPNEESWRDYWDKRSKQIYIKSDHKPGILNFSN